MILDAGVFIAIDRGEPAAAAFIKSASVASERLLTTHPVVDQVWRGGSRQVLLSRFLKNRIVKVLNFDDGRPVGVLLGLSRTHDPVDTHLVIMAAATGHDILTSDVDDLKRLAASLEASAPRVLAW